MKPKKWAKELSLEVWGYLRDHPEIDKKEDLPFYEKIINITKECPLCHIFWHNDYCKGCPLKCLNATGLSRSSSSYCKWLNSKSVEDRAKYAGRIYNKIKAWDINND